LALARLRSSNAVAQLQDMLSRSYWEAQKVDLPGDEAVRTLTPVQVDEYLRVSIDAARQLGDPVLREAVEALTSDPSTQVRMQAEEALRQWSTPPTTGTSRSGPVGVVREGTG